MNLNPTEADVLAQDAQAFASALPDPAARERYQRLASSATSNSEVPDDLVPALETMLELLFERGKPSNPAVLQSVYAKTPRGHTLTTAARDVNRALEALRGHTLQTIRVAAAPSRHTLTLETDHARVTVELDRAGARIASLET
jgi:hypothetical protein